LGGRWGRGIVRLRVSPNRGESACLLILFGVWKTDNTRKGGENKVMLYTIGVVSTLVWMLDLALHCAMGRLVHVLLVVAIIMLLVNIVAGRRGAAFPPEDIDDTYNQHN